MNTSSFYRKYAKAETLMTVTDAVHDIAFAPNLGRSFHVLAIATKDVRIFKLVPLRSLIIDWFVCLSHSHMHVRGSPESLFCSDGCFCVKEASAESSLSGLRVKYCRSPNRKESTSAGSTKFEVQIVAQFDNHNSQVWRVSWNITSTLLASSGDDGCVRLWKGVRLSSECSQYSRASLC